MPASPNHGWEGTNISLQLFSSTDWFPVTLLAWNGLYLAGIPSSPIVVQVFIQFCLWLCLNKGMTTCFFCSKTVIGKSELKKISKGSVIKNQWCWQCTPRHYIPPAPPNSGLVFWKKIKCKSGCQYRVISTGPQNVPGWNREIPRCSAVLNQTELLLTSLGGQPERRVSTETLSWGGQCPRGACPALPGISH